MTRGTHDQHAADARLGPRFDAALLYASQVHGGQVRKGTTIPYVSHLLGVASLVIEDGGTEDEAIGALLHDAAEDQGGQARIDDIALRFGPAVAAIVDGLSDSLATPKPPWIERKRGYLARLENESPAVIRVSIADKLHNARRIVRDVESLGPSTWQRFNATPPEIAWYHRACLGVFERRSTSSLVGEYATLVARLEELVPRSA